MRKAKIHTLTVLLATLVLVAAPAAADVTITINNVDPPGIGFNDPSAVAPVGGNPAATLGEQRLNVFELAADLWGATLDSAVPVVVQATFSPLACTPTGGTLGAAGTIQIFGFNVAPPGAIPGIWYHSALFNKLLGFDATPGPPDPGLLVPPFNDDIVAFFNGDIGVNPNCLTGLDWYYGLDNNAPAGTIDLLNVVMHEIGHGLGFANFVNETTGAGPLGLPDIYTVYSLDTTTGLHWSQMTDAERAASAVNDGNVVWDGATVTSRAACFLGPQSVVSVSAPGSIAGSYVAQAASFGPALASPGTSGGIVLADDGIGVGSDGCEAITNNVAGTIALIDRGGCAFTQKVGNAQAAGAIGAIVANNAPGGPAPMGGSDPSITIPSVGITLADGNTIKGALPGVVATIGLDASLLSGADANGFVKLYAPSTVAPGSSISHWDVSATPNLLMEPFNTGDLATTVTTDLTPYLFADEGWSLADADGDGVADIEDGCLGSDTSAMIVIDGCDSGVTNALLDDGDVCTFGGCTMSDLIAQCAAGASNHGGFVSCTSQLANGWKKAGLIRGNEKGAITSCAAGSSLP